MNSWYLYCKKGDFASISEKFGISPILARILVNRGIKTDEDIRTFLYSGKESMHDPYLFNDMEKAVLLIMENIHAGKKIRIIGDYDMDGVCASVILKKFLEYIGGDVDVRLPHRILEGYGMNESMADDASKDGISLIITCDNGISSYAAVCRANELGIDVIITDHHEVPADVPPAIAIIDAKRQDCTYPYKQLCGASVAYKLDQAIVGYIKQNGHVFSEGKSMEGLSSLMDELLQFAGMATIADIVPLQGENRIFAREGINTLKHSKNAGIRALMSLKGIERQEVSEYHIGFILAPCINSAGRLKKAQIAFDLFDTDDDETARSIAEELAELNEKRKDLTHEQTLIAEKMINDPDSSIINRKGVMVIYLPEAHESVAGIIAGKLKDEYNCPVLIITDSEDGLKGSGRSNDDYNLIAALSRHPELFKKFGGHAKAAGFTLECTPEELSDILNSEEQALSAGQDNRIWIDMQLPFRYITEDLVNELKLLEPYGLDNDRPRFAEKNVRILDLKIIGKNSNVLKMNLRNEDGDIVEGIYFGHEGDSLINDIPAAWADNEKELICSVLYKPNINEFNNYRRPQAVIEDIRI